MMQRASRISRRRTSEAAPAGEPSRVPASISSGPVSRFQHYLGNQAIQRSLTANGGMRLQRKCAACTKSDERLPGPLQKKLTINEPGDRFEREADHMADAVMRMSTPPSAAGMPGKDSAPATLQRACACGGTCDDCKEKEATVQRAESGAGVDVTPAPPIVHEVLRSPGQPLDSATRSFMEPRLGADFSGVRVHTDGAAAESADAVNARAYTVGQQIVFAHNRYSPSSVEGQRLMAHELTHVVQQSESHRVPSIQRACGEHAIGNTPSKDCVLVPKLPAGKRFLFNVNCDDFATGQQAALEKDIRSIPSDAKIDILGMASAEGKPGFNTALSCRRAAAAASAIRGIGFGSRIRKVEATGPVAGTEHDKNFRAVAISVTTPRAARIRVVAKSYIAPIGSFTGSATCAVPLLIPPTPVTPIPIPVSAQRRLELLAAATDVQFSEDPRTDVKDKHYRLYSERSFLVSCLDGALTSVTPTPLDTDAGKEGPIQAPPLLISDVTATLVSPTKFTFGWKAKGRPHPIVEPGFQAVCPRDSVYIWHKVQGEIDCSGLKLAPIVGSHFPSHRVFLSGILHPPTVPQGPFRNLWISDPTDKTQVD